MQETLSIRSYSRQVRHHSHGYYQVVLTLNGHIGIAVEDYQGKVSVGEAIIIAPGQVHKFAADVAARFVVADLLSVPPQFIGGACPKFCLDAPLLAFVHFVDQQLSGNVNPAIELLLVDMLQLLLVQQPHHGRVDRRIEKAISVIQAQLGEPYSVEGLASIACLGATQFKRLFQQSTGLSVGQYLIKLRMEKARSLLTHTDLPVTQVALEVGYEDSSAFSRRFKLFYGQPPRAFQVN